ncbi:hypothetical protein [Aliiroseovarius sp.]|uniref:hypothetical protein n=1 Tax=Aliiroseovarius sp. TaxID=1872442 RepID=UPI003BAA2AA3
MSEQMRSYSTARRLFSILEFGGRVIIAIGLIVGYILAASVETYVSDGTKILLFLLVGLGASFIGLIVIGAVQNWRAGVDSAEYNQQMLKVARDQLAVSRQALRQGTTQPQGFAAATQDTPPTSRHGFAADRRQATAPPRPEPQSQPQAQARAQPQPNGAETIAYKGKTIEIRNGAYAYNSLRFETLEEAQAYIDEPGMRSLPEPFRAPE